MKKKKIKIENLAIFGAGKCGEILYKSLKKKDNCAVSYFIDDNTKKKKLFGINILNKEQFIFENTNIKKIIIAIPSLDNLELQRIISFFLKHKIEVFMTPDLWNIKSGFPIDSLLQIDPYLVLDRDPININNLVIMNNIKNKKILIFGGAGSIGREVAHQSIGFAKSIYLLDNNELNLFNVYANLKLKCKEGKKKTKIYCHLSNLEDKDQFEEIFKKNKIDIVINAAAYKHVISGIVSPKNLMISNIKTCLNTFEICQKYLVEKYIYISTDKAANPKNYMGLSKLICEEIINSANLDNKNLKISKVRFGNVFGSMGSAIPIFLEQIKKGGPVIIRDKNLFRYFLSIPEAAQLILTSITLGKKGEIFAFDMGSPIKINLLVKRLIQIYGVSEKNIEIRYSKLLKTEKLKEKLFHNEIKLKTKYKQIFKIQKKISKKNNYYNKIYDLSKKFTQDKNLELKNYLREINLAGLKIKEFI